MERTISDTLSWNSLGGNFPSGRLQRGASIQSDSMRHAYLHALHIKSYQDIDLFLLCQQCHQGKKGEQFNKLRRRLREDTSTCINWDEGGIDSGCMYFLQGMKNRTYRKLNQQSLLLFLLSNP